MQAVFARLLALNLALQVLNMKILFNLGLVFLTLELSHFFLVLVLLFRVGILEIFHLFSCLIDFLLFLLLFSLQLSVAILFSHLFSDGAGELREL